MRDLAIKMGKRFKIGSMPSFCIGVVYLWFGMLKFFPGISPAETIAIDTITELTFGVLWPQLSLVLLAFWETTIGLLLIFGLVNRLALNLAIVHMLLTFTPFIFFPELTFTKIPFGLTLLGQYIIKNIVFLAILLFLLSKERRKQ